METSGKQEEAPGSGELAILQYVPVRDSPGGVSAVCERLPAAPAIYAWLRTVRICANRGAAEFTASVTAAVEAPAAPEWTSRLGPLHAVTLESRSELSRAKQDRLESLASNEAFRRYAARILEGAAVLQAPLYVGKAQDLQRRIRQHLDPMSDLSVRLREAGIRLDDCTLAYAVIEDASASAGCWEEDSQILLLMEELITRICRPGFVLRPG